MPDNAAETQTDGATRKQLCIGAGLLALVVFALFWDLLLLPGDTVISHAQGDAAQYHVFLRGLGFEEMRNGNLPLWNPYIFSGSPYLGSMQPALLYPPNIIYLILPIAKAINLDMAVHLFLFGFFTMLWLNRWKLHWAASTYAGIVVMLCGCTYLRVLAGQVNVLANMAWFPLLLLSVDAIIDDAKRERFPSPWCIVGIASTALMIYAAYPQSLFICAICTAVYTVLRLIHGGVRVVSLIELVLVAGLPLFIGALQLWPGVATGMESIRGTDMSYEFGSTYSFPPENMLTMLAPAFFGDIINLWPWGRWGFWDVSMYMGIVGLILMVNAFGREHVALRRITIALTLFTVFVALGRYTPFHAWLFDYVPGFNKFRSPSKFLLVTGFFMAAWVGIGVHNLIHHPERGKWLARVAAGIGIVTLVSGIALYTQKSGVEMESIWWRFMKSYEDDPDTFLWTKMNQDFAGQAAGLGAASLLLASLTAGVSAAFLFVARTRPKAIVGLLVFGVVELMVFAFTYRATFSAEGQIPETIAATAESLNPHERMLSISGIPVNSNNHAMAYRGHSVWGYDPVILERYAAFAGGMTIGREHAEQITDRLFTHGSEPIMLALHLGLYRFTEDGPTYNDKYLQMVRCRTVVKLETDTFFNSFLQYTRTGSTYGLYRDHFIKDEVEYVYHVENPLPRFYPATEYMVLEDWETAFDVMADGRFDPHRHVTLEEEPDPKPEGPTPRLEIDVLDESTDHLTIRVETPSPVLLMMSDAYAEGWKITAISDSVQKEYRVLPANVAFRAIPLEAGAHHFRMEYKPEIFIYARIVTVSSLIAFGLIALVSRQRTRKNARDDDSAS